jgi:glycerol-1-phosphate dehydrogenase [NAD(P)+]
MITSCRSKSLRWYGFSLSEWREALRRAPTIKDDSFTILSEDGALAEVEDILVSDPRLEGCFTT